MRCGTSPCTLVSASSLVLVCLAGLACLACVDAHGGAENMIGRQSQNEGMLVLPARGRVVIDGELSDWDWSGRIWSFADSAVRSRYSVEAAAMWDAGHLYLAAKWRDPTPAYSTVDPEFNPNDGWKSDSWQLRVMTDRKAWLTTWFYTPKRMPLLHVAYWKDDNNSRAGQDVVLLGADEGGTVLRAADGGDLRVEMAYRKSADGKGFVQEMKLPWSVIFRDVPEVAPGLVFRMGSEFLWGDPTGKTWPVHRYADNMQPGKTSREFYWTNWKAWGEARLVAKGNVPVRRYVGDAARLEGTVPIRVTVPKSAARFTVAIDDERGRRVRNLAGDLMPEDYTVDARAGGDNDARAVEIKWDCLDDKGVLVRPGTYRVRALAHDGLGAEYETCFYNPGTPPWPTRNGAGAWGADHGSPNNVATAGEWMIVSWPFAEGGSGIIGIDADGKKRWGEKRGAKRLAADGTYVYAVPSSWHIKSELLCRISRKDGSYRPFELGGKPRPFELPVADIFAGAPPGSVSDMAAGGGKLVLAMTGGKIAVLDAGSAELVKAIDAPEPTAVALATDGTIYAVLDGTVHRVDVESGETRELVTRGLVKPGDIAVDSEGNVVVMDLGPDYQVKAYRLPRKVRGRKPLRCRLAYTAGRQGGRPVRGEFDEEAMSHVSSIAVDGVGHIWVTESWNYPRRVSVWNRDGALVRDYVGNTGYAGTGCCLHEEDPALAYVGPIEIELDKEKRAWRVARTLWHPEREKGESFAISSSAHVNVQRFASSASGRPREYMYTHPYDATTGHVVYMKRGAGWQPVAAVCWVGHFSGKIIHSGGAVVEEPSGEFADLNGYDGCFWNDLNRDGKVQRAECEVVPAKRPAKKGGRGEPSLSLSSGWGGRIGSDLAFYAAGLVRYRPVGFTDDGAPRYGREGMESLGPALEGERGDLVPVPEEELLLCLSFRGYAGATTGMLGIDLKTNEIAWSYPNRYPGVHGSHRATMPKPGLLIGPLKICGVANVNDEVGRVFVMRGNLGQDFFMTTDGLYVGALFQDGRLPGDSLPDKEGSLIGTPMEGFSHGGEPFNGWFGKQADGKIRMTTGFPRQAAMILEVTGLDTIRRIDGGTLTLDIAAIMKADEENAARAKVAAKPKRYVVTRMAKPPAVDGNTGDWRGVPAINIEREGRTERASARLAYDGANLYALFEVVDRSPWRNEGKDVTRLFKTGDAVDIQLNTDPAASARKNRRNVLASDVRVLISKLGKKPVAVVMKPVDPGAGAARKVVYHSPVMDKTFDRVEVLAGAKVAVKVEPGRYRVEAAIPLRDIGLEPRPGVTLRGDVGVISSDAHGTVNAARTYWSNTQTNLVSDLPQESWLNPDRWGELILGE